MLLWFPICFPYFRVPLEYHRPFQKLEFLEVDPSTMPCVPWDWRAMRTPDCTPSQNACDNCVESWNHPFCRQSDHDPARKPAQEDEMNDFLNHLATFLDLHFEAPEAMRCIWDISCLRWQFVEAAIMQSESHMKATFQNESNLLFIGANWGYHFRCLRIDFKADVWNPIINHRKSS